MQAEFEAEPGSVRRTRDLVRRVLGSDHPSAGTAVLVTSELATNAVVHANTDFTVCVESGPPVRIEVADGSTEKVVPLRPTELNPAGRGLTIVAALADRWGVEYADDGKRVWVELE